MSARPHAYLQDTHPERPRSTSKTRTPFGPSNGSETFFQYLIIMSGGLLKQRRMDVHVDERQSACNRLAGHQFSISCNEMSGYLPFGPVLSAHLRVSSRKNIHSGDVTHLENRHGFVRTIEPLNRHVHRRKEELGGHDQEQP